MLKFFRQYHKLILVVGASFLMVAFLIQPVLSMFMTSPQDAPIGRINGQHVTIAERNTAQAELQLLRWLNPEMGLLASQLAEGDPVKWLLMVRDARGLGLDVSRMQVEQLLHEVLGLEDAQITTAARQVGGTDDLVRQAARHWLIVEQYRGLMLGQEHINPIERLVRFVERARLIEQAHQTQNFELLFYLQQLRGTEEGAVRISEPLMHWFIANHQATVSGQALVIDAEAYADAIDAPTEAQLEEHFQAHRDLPPGESEPFGFGYRHPDRVRLEWLAMPIDELREQIEVDFVDVADYFRANRERFADRVDPDDDRVVPRELRQEIESRLRQERAQRLAQRLASSAHAALQRELRGLDRDGDYRQIPDDFQPTSLEELADRLEQEHGVRPRVERWVGDDQWVAVNELDMLPGLGRSHLEGRPEQGIARYVGSARELEPDADNPLAALALQLHAPGRVMADPGGSRYVFRLVGAAPSAPPESLDDVRDEVERDVRRLLAYRMLQDQRETWQQRAASEGFEPLADEAHVRLQPIREVERRRFMGMTDELEVPSVPGIGRSSELVDTMFEIAERVTDRGREPVDAAPEDQRIGAVSIDAAMALTVFRVDGYRPVTRRQLQQTAAGPGVEVALSQLLIGVLEDPLFAVEEPALTKEAVARRVGFEAIELADPPADAPRSPAGPRPGAL